MNNSGTFRNLSVKKKLTIISMIISIGVLLLASIFFVVYDTIAFRDQMARELSTFAKLLGNTTTGALVFQDEVTAQEILSALKAKQNVVSAVLYKQDAEVLAQYHRYGDSFVAPEPEEEGHKFSDKHLTLFQEVVLDGEVIGTLYIQSDLEEIYTRRKFILLAISVLVVLIGIGNFISLFFVRIILAPLERMTNVAVRMAEGDFTQEIQVTSTDEVGILANAFSKMSTSLNSVIRKIQDASKQIGVIAGVMFDNTKKVNEGAANQARSAEQTSASVEQMDSSIKSISESVDSVSFSAQSSASSLAEMSTAIHQVATSTTILSSSVEDTATSLVHNSKSIKEMAVNIDTITASAEDVTASIMQVNASIKQAGKNAKESALLSENVSQDAVELGRGAIEKTIEGMEKIKKTVDQSSYVINKLDERTTHIGTILTVIDEVTRQTNLLALNAAILAAQAGTEGKGFAVVADEIKGLADRTATSTKEIAQLIKDVQVEAKDAVISAKEGSRSVEEGVRLSNNARVSLDAILNSSKRSSEMSRQIESATMEQVKAINQVAELMEKMNGMIQQVNVAMKGLEGRTFQMTEGAEKMRTLTRQVSIATDEQAKGSKQATDDVENVTARIQRIALAMNEQKKGNEIITHSMVEIRQVTQVSVQLVQAMNEVLEGLMKQADFLNSEVGKFQV